MKKLLTCILLALMFVSCQKEESIDTTTTSTPTPTNKQLWPLAIGNEWTYNFKEFGESGATILEAPGTYVISGKVSRNNKEYFVLSPKGSLTDTMFLLRSTENEVYAWAEAPINEMVMFRTPAAEGEVLFTGFDLKMVASSKIYDIKGHQSIKSSMIFLNGGPEDNYAEFYVKPGAGLTGVKIYDLKGDESALYLSGVQEITSYTLK
jgi:hypothetical protein